MPNAFAHDPAEDRRLAAEAQKGDLEALDALVRRQLTWIFHVAHRMLWNRADAVDATQEIFTVLTSRDRTSSSAGWRGARSDSPVR